MFFTAAFALAAASLAMAQGVTINSDTLTQCAQSTLDWTGSTGPYYVAVLPAVNPCGSDALAEYYNVDAQSVNYYVNLPSGTQVQVYILDANYQETWGPILTVGDGDSSCLGGASDASVDAAAVSTTDSTTASSTDSSTTPSTSSAPTTYIPPNTAATTTPASDNSGTDADTSNDDTPANAANDSNTTTTTTDPTSGASKVTASATLLVGAFAAAIALF